MIGISGRCAFGARRASSGLYPSPSNARARRGCTFRLRAQNGMPIPQSPRVLGGPFLYAMGVFNPWVTSAGVHGRPRFRLRPYPRFFRERHTAIAAAAAAMTAIRKPNPTHVSRKLGRKLADFVEKIAVN